MKSPLIENFSQGAVVPAFKLSSRQNSGNEGDSIHNAAPNQQCDSILERLSPEIRRCLLSILDLPSMKALVHASPVFHQQYLLDRRYLLCASLGTTLQGVLLDAHAVRKSEKCKTPDQFHHFVGILDTWGRPSAKASSQQLTVDITEEEAVHMVSRHIQTIVPIAGYFASWALDEMARQTGEHENADSGREPRSQPALTKTEWLRCLRATYRFQLLCNVASPTIYGLYHSHTRDTNVQLLFNKLKPWEVEELFSFYQFATAVYDKIFSRIKPELRPDNPRFADQRRPPTPEGAFELDDEWSRNIFLEGTVLQGGLALLYTVLFDIGPDDQEKLVSLMQRSIVRSYIPINAVEGILGQTQQRATWRSERSAPGDRAPLPFTRDDLDEPPLAWTLIWGGTYSNLYGWSTPDEMRRWAYVFWDAERMNKCGGRDLVERQWGEYWGGGDPRDNLW